ncbi:hypothetical protein KKA94_03070, partial [Patescibacteria group bacterium]|nr:hypothetical protein [Patescibacteria group bacterium]
YNYNELPFAMYIPGLVKIETEKIASNIDIAPTILNIIEGESYVRPEHFIGSSMFSKDHPDNAVQKCLNGIEYVDENNIAIGNENTSAYSILYSASNYISANDNAKLPDKLKNLIQVTDEMLINNRLVR